MTQRRPATMGTRIALAAAGAVSLIAAACSSGGSASTHAGGAAPSGQGGAVTISTRSGPLGTYLTDGKGRTLYMFASDTATTSTCSGACARFWPPLTTSVAPAEQGGASGTLTRFTRADGSQQVAYDSHPLYYFNQDTHAGDTHGQGSDNFGAKWWVLDPAGTPITGMGPSAPSGAGSSTPAAPGSTAYSGY